jgi:hypothetical protein
MLLSQARRSFLPAAAVAAILWGCSGIKISHDAPNRADPEARAAVAGLVADYENRSAPAFFHRFDQESFPNYEEFRNNVRQFLLKIRQVNIQMIVDRVGTAGSGAAVDAHWNKSFVNHAGAETLQKGTCSLVFTRAPSGELLLAAIQGNSPF